MTKHFHIVSRPGCPFCSLVKHDLTALGHTFEETTLHTQSLRDDFKALNGVSTFPQVFETYANTREGDPMQPRAKRIGGYEETIVYLSGEGT